MQVTRLKKILIVTYILGLFIITLWVQKVLKEGDIDVIDKRKEETVREIKPVNVYLTVYQGTQQLKYEANLKNTESVMDFMDHLRRNEGFYYEKTDYTYGTEYDLINRQKAPEGYKWKIYEGTSDITNAATYKDLTDETIYEIKLEKSQ